MKDYYQILGVDRKANGADIKRAYRKLASQHHPDRGGDSNKFKEIQEAYDTLSDASQRAQYDSPHGFFTQRNNFEDILNQYFTHTAQHRNIRVEMWVSFEESIKGARKVISIAQQGIEIEIPQGIHDREAIRYQGLLSSGGDLVVEYRVHGHPIWQRDGMDLLRTLEVNFWKLITGGEIIFSDIVGKSLSLKIPEQCKPGTMLRLAGQGASRTGHNNGDILIKINAVMPERIPEEIVHLIHKHALNK